MGAELAPFEDDWKTVLDADFAPDVRALPVGGAPVNDNYALRGDVQVFYNLPPMGSGGMGRIVVEMQRLAGAETRSAAAAEFQRTKLWAFRGDVVGPADKAEADSCSATFVDGCSLRVYHDGDTQPAWVGANLRIFLPADHRGRLTVVTQDLVWPDCSYLRRSQVEVKDLPGSAFIELGAGQARVELADDILPAPYCDPDPVINAAKNATCEAYVDPDTMAPKAWDRDCGCLDRLGSVDVRSNNCVAADITVDAPPDLWATINVLNSGANQRVGDTESCPVTIRCDQFTSCTVDPVRCNMAEPWICAASANLPSGAGPLTGFGVQLGSARCEEVEFHPAPSDDGAPPDTVRRGFLEACSGCLDIPDVPAPI